MQANTVAARPQVSPVVYSGLLGRIVQTVTPHSEADPVGILGALLSAFSSAVTNLPQAVYGTQSQTLSTWIVLIGNTGMGRKGTATRAALQVVRGALPDWAKATILEGCPQSGPAYVSTLADMNGNALMIEEEFADLLKVSARYKSFGKAIRRSWEGASISNRTKEAVIHVDAPHVSIIGNVTPAEFSASIGKADRAGGTLNRFLCLYVERSKKIKLSEQISVNAWSELMRPLVREFRNAVTFARDVEEVTVSRSAMALWDDKLSEMIDSMTLGREAMEQFAARAADYVWRLSALYALADRRDEISTQDLEAAVGLVSYMCDSVTYLSPEVANGGGTAEETVTTRVEQFIKAAGPEGVNSTALFRKFGRKAQEMKEIIAELPTIATMTVKPQGGGRPATVYVWQPVDETAQTNDLDLEELPEIDMDETPELEEELAESATTEETTPEEESVPVAETPASLPFYLSDDEWDEIDAAQSVTPEPETAPESELVEEVTEEPTVSEEAVKAFLSSPAGAEMLQEILMSMMAKQSVRAPQASAAPKAKAPRRSRAKSTPEALFQAPEVAA
ncbi:DUF3987 domain-containing protein [Nonomuraea roseoviolacea]|uniref:DUF3987 domain-containing protein n=1 Tax=Nonomuraea roseoviolacea subsp. carminata TaxID=160689 RepID=A0ABT1K356_9ACTN|nr:DUF3987 domain-containing protein [Nonomuraea roseoviolacea]MCP2348421.1 hypothetical protein [Nonomuraea roseoviolacea subsp. carminata]